MRAPNVASPRNYGNQATQRVMGLLAEFAGADESRGISELAREMGMNKNMVHRSLATLVDAGFLVRSPDGRRYQLGYRLLQFEIEDGVTDIRALARPTLKALHDLTGESVFQSIMVGGNRVNVDWIEGQGRRVSMGQRGRTVPLHVTTMSRMLLAHLPDDTIEAYLAGVGPLDAHDALFPVEEPTTEKAIWRDVGRMRKVDHLIWRNRKMSDGAYVCYPIAGSDGRLHTIITIGGPAERFDPEQAAKNEGIVQAINLLRIQCIMFPAPPVAFSGRLS